MYKEFVDSEVWELLAVFFNTLIYEGLEVSSKKLIEKSKECHNHKSQPPRGREQGQNLTRAK